MTKNKPPGLSSGPLPPTNLNSSTLATLFNKMFFSLLSFFTSNFSSLRGIQFSLNNKGLSVRLLNRYESYFKTVASSVPDVLESLSVLNLSFVECTLLYLDLFVEKGQLVITPDKLSTQDISLIDYLIMIVLIKQYSKIFS